MDMSAPAASDAAALFDDVAALRATLAADAAPRAARLAEAASGERADLANLAAYLALRDHDLRPLQRRLMRHGLSSLGRLESRVMPTLDAVLATLAPLAGRIAPAPAPDPEAFFAGEARLEAATLALFGPAPQGRQTRIMVTLPTEAAHDGELVMDFTRRGMDVARINCAHDGPDEWRAMAAHIRAAAAACGHEVRVLMDIAGPKIRTGEVLPAKGRLHTGETLRLVAHGAPRPGDGADFSAAVTLPEIVTRLCVGDRVRYNDGKVEAVVESLGEGEALLRVLHTRSTGVRMKPEKGLNLPDTALGLSPLTAKDNDDLPTVLECADMIGYSFVSRPEDIDLLDDALARHGRTDRPLGIVAKIERPEALRNLPALIARAVARGPFAVMIARGDLAAEIGFERTAEMQEELLWICEAAAVPAIWATQVLEDLVRDGIPSRGEMTDAAMSARAEAVMLNKGPALGEAITLLDGLLGRMEGHVEKKTPTLRALHAWREIG